MATAVDVETNTTVKEQQQERSTGTVKWFSAQKGYGFVAIDDGGDDLFVHQTSIKSDGFRSLTEGQPVEFSIDFGEDGRTKAIDVVPFSRSRRSLSGRGVRGGGGRGYFNGRDGGGRGSGGGGRDDSGRVGGGRDVGYERRVGGPGRGGGKGGGGGRDFECYNCGRMGHLARDCYHRGESRGGGRGYGSGGGGGGRGGYYGGGGGGRGGGGRGGACYSCGEEGHLARDCPNNNN